MIYDTNTAVCHSHFQQNIMYYLLRPPERVPPYSMPMLISGLVILPKYDPNGRFLTRVTLKSDGLPRKTIGSLFHALRSYVFISYPSVNSNSSYQTETLKSVQNRQRFQTVNASV